MRVMFYRPKCNRLILLLLLVLLLLSMHNSGSTSSINTTTLTTITTIPKGMKMKYSRNFQGDGILSHNTPSVCNLSKGPNVTILGTVWVVKLKLIRLVVGDVEPTKKNICILMQLLLLILLLLLLLLILLLQLLLLKLRLLLLRLLQLLLLLSKLRVKGETFGIH